MAHHSLHIVAIDVEDGRVERLGHIGAVGGAAALLGVCRECNLQQCTKKLCLRLQKPSRCCTAGRPVAVHVRDMKVVTSTTWALPTISRNCNAMTTAWNGAECCSAQQAHKKCGWVRIFPGMQLPPNLTPQCFQT